MHWLLCDFGNVLVRRNPVEAAKLLELSGLSESELRTRYWAQGHPYDASLTLHDYWSSILQCGPGDDRVEQLVATDIAMWMNPIQESIDAVSRSKARGYRLALFSNAPVEFVEPINSAPWLSNFERCFLSCDVGAKPAAEAFLRVCKELDATPSQVTFIDDRPENIEGAAALGMRTALFTRAEQMDEI